MHTCNFRVLFTPFKVSLFVWQSGIKGNRVSTIHPKVSFYVFIVFSVTLWECHNVLLSPFHPLSPVEKRLLPVLPPCHPREPWGPRSWQARTKTKQFRCITESSNLAHFQKVYFQSSLSVCARMFPVVLRACDLYLEEKQKKVCPMVPVLN